MISGEYNPENCLHLTDSDETKHAKKYLVRWLIFITNYNLNTLELSRTLAYHQVECDFIWYEKKMLFRSNDSVFT